MLNRASTPIVSVSLESVIEDMALLVMRHIGVPEPTEGARFDRAHVLHFPRPIESLGSCMDDVEKAVKAAVGDRRDPALVKCAPASHQGRPVVLTAIYWYEEPADA